MPTPIQRRQVQDLLARGAQLIEVLPAKEFDQEHIEGANSVPLRLLSQRATDEIARDQPVIVYCYDSA